MHCDDGSRCWGEAGHIVQIMPAVGWRAVLRMKYLKREPGTEMQSGGEEVETEVVVGTEVVEEKVPLVCFALVEDCAGNCEVAPLVNVEETHIERADLLSEDAYRGLLGPGEGDHG